MLNSKMVRQMVRRAPQPVVRGGRRVASLLPGGDKLRTAPLLSIVLPIYNVEAYLADCLDSILAQDLRSFEVVVVDDGSPDGSAAIARRYARRDPRIRVHRQANAGLGAARNAGLRRASGRYLMFVDSDDRLPAGALSALVGSCQKSGSDIAVGSIVRFNSTRSWAPDWITAIHATDRIGIGLKDFPELLRNNYSWCKVFRRSFWDECGLWFREGVAYEDQPIITQLYLRAAGVDVLSQTVYEYRARDDASSISQQTGTVKDLRDRAAAWLVSRDALRAEAPSEVYQAWLQTLFSTHFHWYLDNPAALDDEDYWAVLHEVLADLAVDVPAEVWRMTPPQRRVTIELARRGLREDFVEFRRQRGSQVGEFPASVRPDGILLHLPMQGADGPGIDDDLFVMWPHQMTVRHQIRRIEWVEDPADPAGPPQLRLQGFAYIPYLDLRVHDTEVVARLRHELSGRQVEASAVLIDDPAMAPGSGQYADYSGSALRVDLPSGPVVERASQKWTVELEVRTAGFVVGATVNELAPTGSAPLLETHVGADGQRLVLDHRSKLPLRVFLDKPRPVVTAVRLDGRTVHGTVRPVPGRDLVGVHVVFPGKGGAVHRADVAPPAGDGTQTFTLTVPPLPADRPGVEAVATDEVADGGAVPEVVAAAAIGQVADGVEVVEVATVAQFAETGDVADVPDATDVASAASAASEGSESAAPNERPMQRRWALRAELARGTAALTFPTGADLVDVTTVGSSVLALERTRRGNLGVIEWRDDVAVVESVEVADDGDLVLGGRHPGMSPLALHVEGLLGRTASVAVVRDGDRFTARVPLRATRGRFGELFLQAGKYWLEADEAGVRTAVVVDRALARALPLAFEHERLAGRLTRTAWGRLQLSLLTPRGESVRSRAQQKSLATSSAALVPERYEGLLLRSYFGESATDNGVGLVRELQRRGVDTPVRWAVRDFSVPVPDGVEPVVHGSREWYRLLRTSRYYMDNMYQPEFHQKPAGQVIVQTFHGYPFKLMGHSHWEAAGFARPLVEAYDRRTADWDYMVSPAPYATPLLQREFRYGGEVLEIGYPRNDALFAADADQVRATVRTSLGIRDDQVAVLYAPTFRDYVAKDNHQAELLDLVGMDALAEELGDGFVVLNRSHAFNARSGQRLGSRGNLVDVTDYPEVSDLYLAADAAVADYSSLRFDFAVTGKPMLFYVPDLERYRETRGWIIDYEPTAPGPLLAERADLVRELRDLDGVRARYREAYARFRRDYIPLEDGQASARLVDAVFVPRGDAPPR